MYKLEIVRNGVKIVRTGDSPIEVVHRTEKWLKNFHDEEHTLELDGMTVSSANQVLGTIEKILPASC
jgi:hypothetical protein